MDTTDNMNINDIMREVTRIACHADLSSYPQIKRHALEDIYDAIANVLPVDHTKREVPRDNDRSRIFCDVADVGGLFADDESDHQLEPVRHSGMSKYLHITDHLQLFRFRGSEFTKFIGRTAAHDGQPARCYEIKVFNFQPKGAGGQAEAYIDGERIFSIVSTTNIHMIEKLAVSALKRWCKEHLRRGAMRKKKRNATKAGKIKPNPNKDNV